MERILKIIVMGVVLFSLVSCTTDPKIDDDQVVPDDSADSAEPRDVVQPEAAYTGDPIDEPGSPLNKRVFYFDFNASDISDEDRQAIEAHARYLSENSSRTVVLEGHADERGSREYNISLGERRAKAVQQLLVVQGAAKSQIQVISFGEERPAVNGHDETAWGQNRRVEMLYSGQ